MLFQNHATQASTIFLIESLPNKKINDYRYNKIKAKIRLQNFLKKSGKITFDFCTLSESGVEKKGVLH